MILFPVCTSRLDLTFLVDISGSLEEGYDMQVAFMKAIVEGLNFKYHRTQVAFVNYAEDTKTRFYLDTYKEQRDVLNAIGITEIGRETNIAAGLREVRTNVYRSDRGDRDGVQNVVLLLSDGRATRDIELVDDEARLVRNSDITIYSIGIGDWADIYTMDIIATDPDSLHRVWIQSRGEVEDTANEVLDRLCQWRALGLI